MPGKDLIVVEKRAFRSRDGPTRDWLRGMQRSIGDTRMHSMGARS
jgi:hypothetical protein